MAEDRPATPARVSVRVAVTTAGLVVVVALLVAGATGLVVAVSGIAVTAALVATLTVPAAPPPRPRRRPGRPVEDAPYRSYRQVAEQLSWAAASQRHYDLVTRPLLVRVAAARLADRHRVDLHTQPERARALLGEDVWPWLDPHRPASRDGQPPGVGDDVLVRVVDRLEHL